MLVQIGGLNHHRGLYKGAVLQSFALRGVIYIPQTLHTLDELVRTLQIEMKIGKRVAKSNKMERHIYCSELIN